MHILTLTLRGKARIIKEDTNSSLWTAKEHIMAKEAKATSAKQAAGTAKRNPFGNTAIRLAGAILAFIGIMLCMEKGNLSAMVITVAAIILIIGGFFVAMTNLRNMIRAKKSGEALGYFFVGLLLLLLGILCAVFRSQLIKWFIAILGAIIAVYGLCILIRFIVRRGSKKRLPFDIIVACFTLICGVLIAILCVGEVSSASDGVCYYIFGALTILTGTCELIAY